MTESDNLTERPSSEAVDLQENLSKEELIKLFADLRPASCADILIDRDDDFIRDVLLELDAEMASEIFGHFFEEKQLALSELFTPRQLANLVTYMSNDERVDFFQALPEPRQESLFRRLAQGEREDIIRLGAYEEGTAGAAMTSEYVTLPLHISAIDAINTLRRAAPEKETIYESYVVDEKRKLIGVVSLKDLILAPMNMPISKIMQTDIAFVYSYEDQELAATTLAKYDVIALPVLNEEDALVGIITHDDVLDIINEEHTEDVEKLMAITNSAGGHYLETSAWEHFTRRVWWVVGLAAVGLISGFVIESFQDVLSSFIILAVYMPMMAATGGNTGSQSTTVVIRALGLQQIGMGDAFKVLWKEFSIAVLLSLALIALTFLKVQYFSFDAVLPSGHTLNQIAWVVSGALGMQVISSTLAGAILPLIAAKFSFDPAVVAAPALTTVVDISGLLIYFTLAHNFLL